VSRSEWNDDEQFEPAPLPAHERQWRHPSEIGEQSWALSEPPLAIGRGLTAVSGAIGGLLALAVLWAILPTEAGRPSASVWSSSVTRTEAAPPTSPGSTAAGSVTTLGRVSTTAALVSPTSAPVVGTPSAPSTVGQVTPQPIPTYSVQQRTESTEVAVAVAVNGGALVITTANAVSADLTVELLLPDGSSDTARVLFVDQRSGLAVLAPSTVSVAASFNVATEVLPGDELTFLGEVDRTVTVPTDGYSQGTWAQASAMLEGSMIEGTPVVNQRGELVALCSHDADDVSRLVPLANLDQLQQAITSYNGTAKVWLGIVLNDDPSGEISVAAVDPAGPAATAGLHSGDVIVTLDGSAVTDIGGLTDALALHVPGDDVVVGIRRADGSETQLTIQLAAPKKSF